MARLRHGSESALAHGRDSRALSAFRRAERDSARALQERRFFRLRTPPLVTLDPLEVTLERYEPPRVLPPAVLEPPPPPERVTAAPKPKLTPQKKIAQPQPEKPAAARPRRRPCSRCRKRPRRTCPRRCRHLRARRSLLLRCGETGCARRQRFPAGVAVGGAGRREDDAAHLGCGLSAKPAAALPDECATQRRAGNRSAESAGDARGHRRKREGRNFERFDRPRRSGARGRQKVAIRAGQARRAAGRSMASRADRFQAGRHGSDGTVGQAPEAVLPSASGAAATSSLVNAPHRYNFA